MVDRSPHSKPQLYSYPLYHAFPLMPMNEVVVDYGLDSLVGIVGAITLTGETGEHRLERLKAFCLTVASDVYGMFLIKLPVFIYDPYTKTLDDLKDSDN